MSSECNNSPEFRWPRRVEYKPGSAEYRFGGGLFLVAAVLLGPKCWSDHQRHQEISQRLEQVRVYGGSTRAEKEIRPLLMSGIGALVVTEPSIDGVSYLSISAKRPGTADRFCIVAEDSAPLVFVEGYEGDCEDAKTTEVVSSPSR